MVQMYRSHLKEALQYQYPDHYGIVLKLLLRGLCHYRSALCVMSFYVLHSLVSHVLYLLLH